ncbi:MAG: RNA 3'-terminal phosphate cyclase [Candidatus Aenigmarchaeota archaeon]|nr:RNA 3'-terminal phosphate cyclase [Candidatus Aenigmarchaeota archaeon]
MILIDGSYLEGGGQIIRTSIALSAITGKPVKIENIRAKRRNPGLRAQHLKGIEATTELCNAELKNAKIGSTSIEFIPKKIEGGYLSIDVGTAGAISLVLQTLVLPSLHAENEVVLEITGGTDVKWSPTTTYFQHIFCDFLKKMNIDIHIETLKHGFYPKGGGKVKIIIKPCKELKTINLTKREDLKRIDIWSIASENLKNRKVAERQVEGAKKALGKSFENVNISYVPTLSPGSSINPHAHFENCKLGASELGERGKLAEKVGEEAAKSLVKQIDSNACLDKWMADQILPYMALAGNSKVSVAEITNHVRTNIWVIEKFLSVKFEIDETNKIIFCQRIS